MSGKVLDLDRGIFSALPEDQIYATGSDLLKTRSEMILRCRQIIQRGNQAHTSEAETLKNTVFETGSYVMLEPATKKIKR